MLPRDLEDLQSHYQSLVDGVSAGSLSYEDAVDALSHIAATDASGVVWRLDINGNFLAAPVGMDPVLSDPQRFVERTSPGPWEAPAFYGNDQQGGAPYGNAGFGAPSTPGFPTPHTNPSASGPGQVSGGAFQGQPYGLPPGQQVPYSTGEDTGRKSPRFKLPSVPDFNGGVIESLKRYRTFIIVGLAALGAALIWSGSSPSAPSTELPVTESTTVSPAASPAETVTSPASGVGTTSLLEVANQLLGQLGTGTADAAPPVVVDPGKGNKGLLRRAQFAGYAAVGLSVQAVEISTAGDKTATAKVNLVNASGAVLAQGTVELVNAGNGWVLKSWPVLG